MTSQFFPEQTVRYKTYVKRTLVDALNQVFHNHPDELLQRVKASIEFPKTEADYPCVVVKFYEREIFNAGVGHEEKVFFAGESDSLEVEATLTEPGGVQLSWPAIIGAANYKVYTGTAADKENRAFALTDTTFIDVGQIGLTEGAPTAVTAALDSPDPAAVVIPTGELTPGSYFYRVTAVLPTQAIKFKHYFYTGDVAFDIYGLSAYDRDLVADTLVQMIAMGTLEAYTSSFFERIYPSNDLYPDSELHFINVNSDQIQGFGDSQTQTPWGAEDDLVYTVSYRVGVFGELYSLPPKLTYAMVAKIAIYAYMEGFETPGAGIPPDDAPWVSNDI